MNSGDVMFAVDLAGIALSLLSLCWRYVDLRNFKAANRSSQVKLSRLHRDGCTGGRS